LSTKISWKRAFFVGATSLSVLQIRNWRTLLGGDDCRQKPPQSVCCFPYRRRSVVPKSSIEHRFRSHIYTIGLVFWPTLRPWTSRWNLAA